MERVPRGAAGSLRSALSFGRRHSKQENCAQTYEREAALRGVAVGARRGENDLCRGQAGLSAEDYEQKMRDYRREGCVQ